LGDFENAFPKVWRDDLLLLLAKVRGLSPGVVHLVGHILALDVVVVELSGYSVILIRNGLPEGGVLGPVLYPLIPDTLAKAFSAAKCGVGWRSSLPRTWDGYRFTGRGVPQHDCVQRILTALRTGASLPSAHALALCAELEASAARALDLWDDLRLHILLHADDPLIFASSWGELCRMISIMEEWGPLHGARFHVGQEKSVISVIGGRGPFPDIAFVCLPGSPAVFLAWASGPHRWLGWMWLYDGGALATMDTRLRTAAGHLSSLAGLVAAHAIPLPLALFLYDSKVDACLAPGRWMYAVMAPSPEATLDAFLCNSARALLGLPPWKTGMAACWELGWCLGGFARGILEVACRRAKLWALPDDDFYKIFFMQGHHVPGSWPARSLALLQAWGLDDWPDCEGDLTLVRYKTSIRAILAHVCCANGATSLTDGSAVPYFSIFPGLVPRDSL